MTTLDDLLQRPEEEFSLTEAALVLAKESPELNNDFDIRKYINKVKQIGKKLKKRIRKKTDPEEIISEINKYLFQEQGFNYNHNFFLNKVLDEKKGSCEGLSILYLALAEQLNLPIYGVPTPAHLIVRWDDGEFKRNIETTEKGKEYPDSKYKSLFNISQKSIEKGVYLKSLSKKEVMGTILYNQGNNYKKRDHKKAIQYYNKAIELNPNFAEAYNNRGVAYYDKRDLEKAIQDYNKAIELNPNYAEVYNNRGNVYSYKGDLDRAIQDYNKAIEINPNLVWAYHNRGNAYCKKGEPETADQDFNKASKLNPIYTWRIVVPS